MSGTKVLCGIWAGLRAVLCLVSALLLLAQGYVLFARTVLKKSDAAVFGYRCAVVLTGSMSGTIEAGDLILTHAERDYTAGDIILFEDASGTCVTHRIAEKTPQGFVTKGDANSVADAQTVSVSAVRGKVILVVPHIGRAVLFLKTPAGLTVLSVGLLALCFLPGRGSCKNEKENRRKH